MTDRTNKGTSNRGRKLALTNNQVNELKRLAAAGATKVKLAQQFKVTRASIYNYLNR